jgi:hypothetical protein
MYRVYFTGLDNLPYAVDYDNLIESLDAVAFYRNEGYTFVTMVSENPDCVSLIGATGMDADDYEWKKRR